MKVAGRSTHFCPKCQPLEPGVTRSEEEAAS